MSFEVLKLSETLIENLNRFVRKIEFKDFKNKKWRQRCLFIAVEPSVLQINPN